MLLCGNCFLLFEPEIQAVSTNQIIHFQYTFPISFLASVTQTFLLLAVKASMLTFCCCIFLFLPEPLTPAFSEFSLLPWPLLI
jgi:hypothetical protein